jgi:hypothetical protein
MQHLTTKDFLDLCDAQDAPYPPQIQEHLETCEQCAAVYNLLFAPASREEPAEDIGDACAFCNDVYELFRNRLPLERFIALMAHLPRCEECGDFFDLLLASEAPTPQAMRAQAWLEAAGRALEAAGRAKAEFAAYRITNVYALAASGEGIVIEGTGHLKNGAEFTLKYFPDRTVFRVDTASIGQTILRRRVDGRWIEGWSETEGGQSGCSFHSDAVGVLTFSEPGGEGELTLETMPYSLLKQP